PPPEALIDVDDPQLMTPGNMMAKINAQLGAQGKGHVEISEAGIVLIANVVFHSMAARYREVLSAIATITGKKLRRLYIVGGGSQNRLLNRLTADRTGLQVVLGSVESTTVGNFAIQLAALEQGGHGSRGAEQERIARW